MNPVIIDPVANKAVIDILKYLGPEIRDIHRDIVRAGTDLEGTVYTRLYDRLGELAAKATVARDQYGSGATEVTLPETAAEGEPSVPPADQDPAAEDLPPARVDYTLLNVDGEWELATTGVTGGVVYRGPEPWVALFKRTANPGIVGLVGRAPALWLSCGPRGSACWHEDYPPLSLTVVALVPGGASVAELHVGNDFGGVDRIDFAGVEIGC